MSLRSDIFYAPHKRKFQLHKSSLRYVDMRATKQIYVYEKKNRNAWQKFKFYAGFEPEPWATKLKHIFAFNVKIL